MEILAWLGTDAGKFRGFDLEVKQHATAMGEAAKEGDGLKVIESFQNPTKLFCLPPDVP